VTVSKDLGEANMSMDDAVERLGITQDEHNRWVGVYIGILAVLLAICGVGGGNAAKDATRANIEASNTWAFFQAKNIRRNSINLAADELELLLAAQPAMPAAARQAFDAKIKDYRSTAQKLTTDPVRNEGLDELCVKGKALEVERDVALRKDPYFDWSQALLQIAIVLASVHLIIGNLMLLGLSGSLGALGVLLMLNGFTLIVRLPFLG
jgi:Domain of unknown function (DUF4337)